MQSNNLKKAITVKYFKKKSNITYQPGEEFQQPSLLLKKKIRIINAFNFTLNIQSHDWGGFGRWGTKDGWEGTIFTFDVKSKEKMIPQVSSDGKK